MRTISTLRWVNGAGALIPALTATAPEPDRSGGDLNLPIPIPIPMPGDEAALVTAAGPAPASGTTTPPPAPHRTHPSHAPYGNGNGSADAALRRTTAADSPAGRSPLPVRGESARYFRTAGPAGTAGAVPAPAPGAGRRPVPAGTRFRGIRTEFPCADGDITETAGVESPISRSWNGNCVLRGAGRSLDNGSATMTAARFTGTRPAAFIAAEFSNKA
ncbi:hypothetical protein [Streptomyces nigrescens]|uniref:Uncharacterized protein n=1 Tax=Streptomyces nigrescens TaxID=1920 RepID=A0A640TL18_STRNI|nr:hypothetical protein [Streptomyces libani]WAT98948.1 hypothetical protein STRLI_005062 [Streptomyces libani subsp. libani]GFE24623.1 hypothetical protein Sliba_50760 [Streptomyces libani subsp. libani]GGV94843.1 hypothetical protein GCM10010500_33700 [Streptomyces libani subsp. libani]